MYKIINGGMIFVAMAALLVLQDHQLLLMCGQTT